MIEEAGALRSLKGFLTKKSLEENAHGIAEFLRCEKSLKVPVAYAVANEIEDVGRIPYCFDRAIRKSVELATSGGL